MVALSASAASVVVWGMFNGALWSIVVGIAIFIVGFTAGAVLTMEKLEKQRCRTIGRRVAVPRFDGAEWVARVVGVEHNGTLLVRQDDWSTERVDSRVDPDAVRWLDAS